MTYIVTLIDEKINQIFELHEMCRCAMLGQTKAKKESLL